MELDPDDGLHARFASAQANSEQERAESAIVSLVSLVRADYESQLILSWFVRERFDGTGGRGGGGGGGGGGVVIFWPAWFGTLPFSNDSNVLCVQAMHSGRSLGNVWQAVPFASPALERYLGGLRVLSSEGFSSMADSAPLNWP